LIYYIFEFWFLGIIFREDRSNNRSLYFIRRWCFYGWI